MRTLAKAIPRQWLGRRANDTTRVQDAATIVNRGTMVLGDDLFVRPGAVRTHLFVDEGGTMAIGRSVTIGHGCGLSCAESVVVGDNVTIGSYVFMMDSDFHVPGDIHQTPKPRPIEIEDGATIGSWALILPGSWIGRDAIVDPGSVVAGRVQAGTRVSGNPASSKATFNGLAESDIDERIISIVAHVFDVADIVGPQTPRDQIEMWNSLGAVQLIVSIEENFPDIRISERAFMATDSVGDVIELVRNSPRR